MTQLEHIHDLLKQPETPARLAALHQLLTRHHRIRLQAGWHGAATLTDGIRAALLMHEWPAGRITTTSGQHLANWRNRHNVGTTPATNTVTDALESGLLTSHQKEPQQPEAEA